MTHDDHSRYKLSEHHRHHHHLICSSCGDVEDFDLAASPDRAPDPTLAELAERTAFEPDSHRLDLLGRWAHRV